MNTCSRAWGESVKGERLSEQKLIAANLTYCHLPTLFPRTQIPEQDSQSGEQCFRKLQDLILDSINPAPMVTHLQLKKQPNLTQSFPHKNNKCKLFPKNKQASLEVTGKRSLFNASGKCSYRGDLDIFLKVCGLRTGNGISTLLRRTQKLPYVMKPQEILWV